MSKDNHSFSIAVACEVGERGALLIQHLLFLQKSTGEENWREKWVRRSAKSLANTYPYWSGKQIAAISDSLEKGGYIASKIENANKYDRTKSYILTEKGLILMGEKESQKSEIAFAEMENGKAETENDIFPNGEMSNKVDYTFFVDSFVERGCEEKTLSHTNGISTVEAKEEKALTTAGGAAAGEPTHIIEVHDPNAPSMVVIEGYPKTQPPPHRINLGDRPNAQTPVDLEKSLRKFYTDWPNEWTFGVLENGRGAKYPTEKRAEIVKDFCCWAIENGRGTDTYQRLNARLQLWFRNEQFTNWKTKQATQPSAAAYTPNPYKRKEQ